MSKLVWDQSGEHYYETGVKQGVLYVKSSTSYPIGVAWNGLTAVTESPSGAEETKLYADDTKYLSLRSAEEFGGTIEAYTYPDEFMQCDGSKEIADGVVLGQQTRSAFGLCYRTAVGNDTDGNEHGYKLHLIYGCTASPSERAYATINDSPEAITFSWEFSTVPEAAPTVDGMDLKPVSCITIDSRSADEDDLAALEAMLYGTQSSDPKLPLPSEVYALFGTPSGQTGQTSGH